MKLSTFLIICGTVVMILVVGQMFLSRSKPAVKARQKLTRQQRRQQMSKEEYTGKVYNRNAPNKKRKLKCDEWCEEYDKQPTKKLCRMLREECELTCVDGEKALDVVYLWANGTTPEYKDHQYELVSKFRKMDEWRNCLAQASEEKRSRELGTFRFSMRALLKNVPFVRRVFIITPLYQAPTWLNEEHMMIRMLDTRDVLPTKAVNFNSNSIQFHMDKIPTLSDPFLELNDDFLFLKPVTMKLFIDNNGQLRLFLEKILAKKMLGCWGKIVSKSMELADQVRKPTDYYVAAHQPLIVSKKVMNFIRKTWPDNIASITSHPLRHQTDVTYDAFYIWIADHLKVGKMRLMADECEGVFAMDDYSHIEDVSVALFNPPICKAVAFNDDFLLPPDENYLASVDLLLYNLYPEKCKLEVDDYHVPTKEVTYPCLYSNEVVMLPPTALMIPDSVVPLFNTNARRKAAKANRKNLTVAQLNNWFNIDVADVGNDFVQPHSEQSSYRATVSNIGRGRYWCEFGLVIRKHLVLAQSDVVFVNGLDMGMIRSGHGYIARRLAYVLQMNYAYGIEFINLNSGDVNDQARHTNPNNHWGMQGHAIYTRYEIVDTSILRIKKYREDFYTGRTEFEGEKQLGGKMALFAVVKVPVAGGEYLPATLITLRTWSKRGDEPKYREHVSRLLRQRMSKYNTTLVLMGGDIWDSLCKSVRLDLYVTQRSSVNYVDDKDVPRLGSRWRDDFICGKGFDLLDPQIQVPNAFRDKLTRSYMPIHDHPTVSVNLELGRGGEDEEFEEE